MTPSQFERLTRLFAERTLSRRQALATGGGVAAAGLAVAASPSASAQPATPVASPTAAEDADVSYMFVQTFGAGSIDVATDGVPNLLLVADHVAGQTLYFSDRPERIVGMLPTERFLGRGADSSGFGFTESDPPNAALVLSDDRVLVVELIDPEYDAGTGQVRYQLRVLDDLEQIGLQLESEPLTAADAAGEFSAASLFIDDCPNGTVTCYDQSGDYVGEYPGSGVMGFCWDSNDWCCLPCGSPPDGQGNWDTFCNQLFPSDCQGSCTHGYAAAFSCDF